MRVIRQHEHPVGAHPPGEHLGQGAGGGAVGAPGHVVEDDDSAGEQLAVARLGEPVHHLAGGLRTVMGAGRDQDQRVRGVEQTLDHRMLDVGPGVGDQHRVEPPQNLMGGQIRLGVEQFPVADVAVGGQHIQAGGRALSDVGAHVGVALDAGVGQHLAVGGRRRRIDPLPQVGPDVGVAVDGHHLVVQPRERRTHPDRGGGLAGPAFATEHHHRVGAG
ncbi:hypothetical protein C1Y40_05839 [Mycobacterium talmoniae]|uniref:Uncharacterized protein n=1 Tax=Mycobacterium talmoniae TaxID=1858794 RepID=A0A2S8BBH7_9MYCO|nr:hypothetical protein C1Y40_05839 [Mycobacterium talmoniae]